MRRKNARAIRELRQRAGLTTKSFGEALGVSPRTVEGWEQGRAISKTAWLLIQKVFSKL